MEKLVVPVIGAALKGVIQAGSLQARTEGILVLETRPEKFSSSILEKNKQL